MASQGFADKEEIQSSPIPWKKSCVPIFGDKRGVILVDFLERGQAINSARYVETGKKLTTLIARQRSENKGNILLQHDNTRLHTSILTRETTAEFGWTVLPRPSYSPDLAPSYFNLFCSMKDGLHGKHFADDDIKVAVKKWLLKANKLLREGDASFRSALEKMRTKWW
jgi:transposase